MHCMAFALQQALAKLTIICFSLTVSFQEVRL